LMNPTKLKTVVSIGLAGGSVVLMALLSACGGSNVVSATAVAKCAHAIQPRDTSLPSGAPSQHDVIAKVVREGWMVQASNIGELEKQSPFNELYVFPSSKAAEEAFNIISAAPNAREEWGSGETFRRGNVIAETGQNPSGSLTASAETLLNRCAGPGASQSVIRPPEEVIDGRSRAEIERAGEDGDVLLPNTTGEDQAAPDTTQEPTQEPPSSEDRRSPGSSPVPGGE
jgi:hypothetical protein